MTVFPKVKMPPWPHPGTLNGNYSDVMQGELMLDGTVAWVWWRPPCDAKLLESPSEVMSRHLAEAFWPEGVPERNGSWPTASGPIMITVSGYSGVFQITGPVAEGADALEKMTASFEACGFRWGSSCRTR